MVYIVLAILSGAILTVYGPKFAKEMFQNPTWQKIVGVIFRVLGIIAILVAIAGIIFFFMSE